MKKLLALLVLAVVFAGIAFGILALITPEPPKKRELPPPPETGAVSAALIDGNTGEMLADKEGNLKSYPASTTKSSPVSLRWKKERTSWNRTR